MAEKILVLLAVVGIILQVLPYGMSDLLFSPQELSVLIGESDQFSLILNDKLPQDASVIFSVAQPELVRTDPTQYKISANSTLNEQITVYGLDAGHTLILANVTSAAIVNANNAYVRVTSYHSNAVLLISDVVGWIYFVAWSVSFYPQVYENWKRKSVVGLNFDFLALNLLGFFLYSLFNCGLFWIPTLRDQYYEMHERSAIPVKANDVFFSVHACLITLVTIIQCSFYERASQKVSIFGWVLLGVFFLFLTISLLCSVFNVLMWLEFLYYCSYVKLAITLVKYVPQAFMNYRRQSTLGWSIGNVLLDFTGGILSVLQMLLDSFNFNDWSSIFGDPTKFGLGLFSVVFDILFVIQHYVLYRNRQPYQHLSNYETIVGVDSADAEDIGTGSQSSNSKDAASREFVT